MRGLGQQPPVRHLDADVPRVELWRDDYGVEEALPADGGHDVGGEGGQLVAEDLA